MVRDHIHDVGCTPFVHSPMAIGSTLPLSVALTMADNNDDDGDSKVKETTHIPLQCRVILCQSVQGKRGIFFTR